jgi:ABC-2 type transport system permease protein
MTLTITEPTPSWRSRLLASAGQLAPVLHSEWHKLRTTRSAWWTAGLAAFMSVLLGILRCSSIASAAHPVTGVDYFGASLFGLSVAQFAIAAGGVLIITAEYSGGTMPPTLIATPQRVRLLIAKIGVLAAVAWAYGLLISALAVGIGLAILGPRAHAALFSALAVRRLLGASGLFVAMALIGFGCGTIVRRSAGGLIATAAVLMVPSLAVQVLTGAARQDVIRYLPLRAADALVRGSSSTGALSPLAALGALAAEIAVLLVAGAMVLSRRDA